MKCLFNVLLIILILGKITFGESLKSPKSVAVDKDGYIYVLGTLRNDYGILKFDSQKNFIKVINEKIYSIWIGSGTKDILVGKRILRKINEKDILSFAKYLKTEPRLGKIIEKVIYPEYITIGSRGNVYAIGKNIYRKAGRVGIIDPEDGHTILAFGEFTKEDKPYGLWNPRGIAVDNEGNIYIANQGPYCVKKFSKNGKFIKQWGPRGRKNGEFLDPMGIAIDKRDNCVYVLDSYFPSGLLGLPGPPQMRVQKFTKDGKFIKKWGERFGISWRFGGMSFNEAMAYIIMTQFKALMPYVGNVPEIIIPAGIAVDSKGYVYVAEMGKYRINKYTSNGRLIRRWGKQGKGPGEFDFGMRVDEPIGMAVDKDDNIYVADHDNNRVQKFDTNGKFLMEIK